MPSPDDTYQTISAPTTGDFRDRGSKFFAYAFPIRSEADWQTALDGVKSEHPKARHWCFAYRLGTDGNNFRANDDGEPSGTAGKPILGQIDSFGLTDVFIVVVRYFGGTLLGASGLINAYRAAARLALEAATIETKVITRQVRLEFDYSIMPEVMNAVKGQQLEILEQEFTDYGMLRIGVPRSELERTLIRLKVDISGGYEDDLPERIEGLTLTRE